MTEKLPIDKPSLFKTHFNVWFYGIVAIAGLVYALQNNRFRTGTINDDAVYVLASGDLWNKSISYIFPQIRFDYPFPGLPLLLSPFTKFVAPHWNVLEWLSVVATLFSVVILGKWIRKWMSPAETLAVMALYAFNPAVVKFSGIVMPASFYALAIIISFRLFDDILERPTFWKVLVLGTIAGWGCVLRPEGFVLLSSLVAAVVIKRQKKINFWPILAPLCVWGLFALAWMKTRATPHSEFQGDLGALSSYWSENVVGGISFFGTILRVFFVNTVAGVRFSPLSISDSLSNIFRVSIILTCFTGMWFGFRSLWREKKISQAALVGAGAFCLSYFLIHLFWHVAIPRYAIPMLPFMFIFLVRGVFELHRTSKVKKAWAIAAFACIIVSYASRNVNAVYESIWSPNPMNAPPWKSFKWLKKNTHSDAKILSIIAPSIALYTRRHATSSVKVLNAEALRYELIKNRQEYIVDREVTALVSNVKGTANANWLWNKIRVLIDHHPDWFESIFSEPREKTAVYRVNSDEDFVRGYELYLSARQKFLLGQYDSAFQLLGGSLDNCPKIGGALNLLGALYFLKNDPSNAEQAYLAAIDILPASPVAMLNLATLYQRYNLPHLSAPYITRGLQASIAVGEAEEYRDNVRRLREQWKDNRGLPMVDAS